MSRRGMTYIEVLIYVVLAGMASLAVGAMFSLGRKTQNTTMSGYLVSGQADTALRWIRRDLQETAMVSIVTYPNADRPTQPPGCSFTSARELGNAQSGEAKLNVSQYAKPNWTKHVFYSLKDKDGRRGDLIRWELPLTDAEKDFVPHTATTLPNAFTENKYRRVLLHDVLLANQKVPNLSSPGSVITTPDATPTPIPNGTDYQTDSHGGFRVMFVSRDGGETGTESLTDVNPGDNSKAQQATDHANLVNVRLEILADDKFKPSFFQLEFKVHPHF